jgi:hypothetical protein
LFNPRKIIQVLNKYKVEYLVIGGVAASLHGCPDQTFDLDILFSTSMENKKSLLKALKSLDARWDVPLTAEILDSQFVFALLTKYGDLDIFSHVLGIGNYDEAVKYIEQNIFVKEKIAVLNLEGWLKSKEAVINEEKNPRKLSAYEYLKKIMEIKKSEE